MIQKFFMTSVAPVIAVKGYYYSIPWSFFPSPSSSPSLEGLSHEATKASFTSDEDQKGAEGQAGSYFSPAKHTLGQQVENESE